MPPSFSEREKEKRVGEEGRVALEEDRIRGSALYRGKNWIQIQSD